MKVAGFSMTPISKPLKAFVKYPDGDREGPEEGPYEVVAIAAMAYEPTDPDKDEFGVDLFERIYLLAMPKADEDVAWTEARYITRFEPPL